MHATTAALDGGVFPGTHWDYIADPESVGYSSDALRVVRAYVASLHTTGLMVVVHGKVLFTYGDIAEVSYLASARKSVLAMLMGTHVANGQIRLDETLANLGIDDVGGLLPQEKEATVVDLLSARSGVYHPASNPGDNVDEAPPRGSQPHGTYFLYNNWDFNALGTIFEQRTGQNVYDALATELAGPIGMEDFKREAQLKEGDQAKSIHLAYHMRLSTRDLARLGYLMLRQGDWDGAQLVPKEWVQRITTPSTRREALNPARFRTRRLAYGYLWWIFDDEPSRAGGPLQGAYTAMGAFGQYLTVVPKLDLVIAHKTVPSKGDVPTWDYLRLVDLLVAARSQ